MKKSSITFVALIALFTVAATCFCILEKDEKPVTRFWGHQYGGHKVMDSIVFSHDGATLISGDSEKATLWNLAPLRKVRSFQGANATLSRDDKVVATVVDDPSTRRVRKIVKLWDVVSGKELASLDHPDFVWSIAFSPQQDILATGTETRGDGDTSSDEPGKAYLWDTKTGNVKITLRGHKGPFCVVVFSLDGKMLATGSYDKKVKLWNVATGEVRMTLQGHKDKVLNLAFSPDSKILASSSSGTVKLWDLNTEKELFTLDAHQPSDRFACRLAFHPNGQLLATASKENGAIKLWDVATGKERHILRKGRSDTFGTHSIAFSPDGKTLAAGVEVGEIELLKMPDEDFFRVRDREKRRQ